MRILSWNCNGKFREKFKQISKLNADIYIIQECENPSLSNNEAYKLFSKKHIWIGHNKNKGLGIFYKEELSITNNNWDSYCLRHFISVNVN